MEEGADALRRRAEERVEAMVGFYKHLAAYSIVNLLLFCVWLWQNFTDGPLFPWFVFALGGWGIGVLFHFLNVFVWGDFEDWKRKKVEELLERETAEK